ncbi:MAG: hypothetical protein ABII12_08920 [Planctomycetota bacterium]
MSSAEITEVVMKARKCAALLHVESDDIAAAYDTILRCVSTKWLEEAERRSHRSSRMGLWGIHPLLLDLKIAGPTQVSAVLELAAYINAFRTQASFDEIVKRLRDSRLFEACRFELAMAYRFRMVTPFVSLAPRVGANLADFAVQWSGAEWICECARQQVSQEYDRINQVSFDITEGLKRVQDEMRAKVTVKVIVEPPYNPDVSRIIPNKVRQLIGEWKKRPWHIYEAHDNSIDIKVYTFCDADDPNPLQVGKHTDWSMIIDLSSVPRKEVKRRSGDPLYTPSSPPMGRTFVRVTHPSIDVEEGVLKRIKGKLDQTKNISDSQHRIILIESLGCFDDFDWQSLTKRITAMMKERTRVAGIGVLFRHYGEDHRWRYGGGILPNTTSPWSIPIKLITTLRQLEDSQPYG